MPCPTCDHTMHKIATVNIRDSLFWCPRCGTIKNSTIRSGADLNVPKLPSRASQLCESAEAALAILRFHHHTTTADSLSRDIRTVLESCRCITSGEA